MKNILFLDVESTGVNYDSNELIEIACLFYEDGVLIKSFHGKINPSYKKHINLGALKINKLSLMSCYNDRETVAKELTDFLTNLPSSKENPIYIGGHNVAFDIQMIKEFLKEQNIIGWSELFSYSVIDTSTIGNFLRNCGKIQFSRMSLAKLAESLKIEVDKNKTHGAEYDAELSAKCYFAMVNILKNN